MFWVRHLLLGSLAEELLLQCFLGSPMGECQVGTPTSHPPPHFPQPLAQVMGIGRATRRITRPSLHARFVLAVGSAVFDAMFNGGMATTSTEIELPDVEPAAFLALLK